MDATTTDTPKRELREQGWLSVLRWRGFVWLIIPLVWALAYLPQLQSRDLFHEEGRRAMPAAEMVASGNWIMPTIYGESYLNKPPLFFWIAAGFGKIQGHVAALSIRLPSVLSALLGAWIILLFARRDLSRPARALAALIFLSTPIMLDKGTLGEIDAFLSLVAFATFVAIWAAYDADRGKIALWGWLLAGFLMGMAVLAKGPGGPIQFYVVFIPFLLLSGKGRWKLLLSPGHFLMLALTFTPIVIWIYLLLTHTTLDARTVTFQWLDQMGLRAIFHTPTAFKGQKQPSTIRWIHYVDVPWDIVTMLFPWSLLAIAPVFPKFARKVGWIAPKEDPAKDLALTPTPLKPTKSGQHLWLLLALGGPAILAFFWIYPMAFARHAMMIVFPVCLIVALFVATPITRPWPQLSRFLPLQKTAALVLLYILAILCIAAPFIALKTSPATLLSTSIVAAGALIVAICAERITVRTPVAHAPIACACSLALLMMLGRGVTASIFNPKKAPSDATRILHNQMDKIVPHSNPIYTTRTLLSGKGNNYFNAQFYLPQIPSAIDDFSDIPAHQKVTILLTPEELPQLLKEFPATRTLGILSAKNGPPPLIVTETTLP